MHLALIVVQARRPLTDSLDGVIMHHSYGQGEAGICPGQGRHFMVNIITVA